MHKLVGLALLSRGAEDDVRDCFLAAVIRHHQYMVRFLINIFGD